MTEHFGSCLCGTVRFEIKGDFDSFYLCHCQYCQKDTGSAHAANLFSQSAKLVWRSGAGLLVVPAGCLDTEISIAPTAHIFLSSKAVWDEGLGEVPEFEGLPD